MQFVSIGVLARFIVLAALLLPLCGCLTSFFGVKQAPGSMKPAPAEIRATVPDGSVTTSPESPPKEIVQRPADPPQLPAGGGEPAPGERLAVVSQGDTSYENTTLTEDVTWRGTVLVRGWLVIAPQATLRVEPGTVVRFIKSPILRQPPLLVVQGRIHCSGTPGSPVLFTSNLAEPARGDWGGILLLSSAKRNQFEHVRIEGARTGIEADFSTLLVKGVEITRSTTGMLLRDATATLAAMNVNGCDAGIESHDSEVELRESTLVQNRRGVVASDSTLVLLSVTVRDNQEQGILADRCRIRFDSCDLSGNGGGARISGGEGQISATRVTRNRGFGLQLSSARIRIQSTHFAETVGDGIRLEDGRSLIWNCGFAGNSGYNLVYSGQEEISAVLNWWGSRQDEDISAKLQCAGQDGCKGRINIAPWLTEKPVGLP